MSLLLLVAHGNCLSPPDNYHMQRDAASSISITCKVEMTFQGWNNLCKVPDLEKCKNTSIETCEQVTEILSTQKNYSIMLHFSLF